MKTNKFAAGALALAMGLAAIAPAYADDTTKEPVQLKSYELFQEQYKVLLERTNTQRNKYLAAKVAYEKADAELKLAIENLAKELKAYEDIINPMSQRIMAYNDAVKRAEADLEKYAEKVAEGKIEKIKVPKIEKTDDGKFKVTFEEKEVLVHGTVNTVAKKGYETEFQVALKRLEAAQKDLEDIKSEIGNAVAQLQKVKAAETARDVAQTNFDKAKKEYAKHFVTGVIGTKTIWETSLEEVKMAAEGYNVTIVATEKGIVVVKKEDTGISAETRAKLEKAISEAEQKILAVKFLKETTPKTIAKVVDKLDKIVAEQEALIKSAKELLGKKAAFSLISTAYADEEKTAEEKAKELTDKLNENTAEIEKTLKENEANQGKDEKPDDTKKPEEKPADTKKPAKNAGKNAKTGIAGVAGVAGVLAAASVAYATSKKNK